jgi:hypothetical protein
MAIHLTAPPKHPMPTTAAPRATALTPFGILWRKSSVEVEQSWTRAQPDMSPEATTLPSGESATHVMVLSWWRRTMSKPLPAWKKDSNSPKSTEPSPEESMISKKALVSARVGSKPRTSQRMFRTSLRSRNPLALASKRVYRSCTSWSAAFSMMRCESSAYVYDGRIGPRLVLLRRRASRVWVFRPPRRWELRPSLRVGVSGLMREDMAMSCCSWSPGSAMESLCRCRVWRARILLTLLGEYFCAGSSMLMPSIEPIRLPKMDEPVRDAEEARAGSEKLGLFAKGFGVEAFAEAAVALGGAAAASAARPLPLSAGLPDMGLAVGTARRPAG